MKKLFLTIVALFLLAIWSYPQGISESPQVGDGTENNPYQIETLANLLWIYENQSTWNKHFIQKEDIDASATATWDESKGWNPIGYSWSYRFSGVYNGNGKTISGLTINRPDQNFIGLFGYTVSARFFNIILTDVNIKANHYAGSIVGFLNFGSITNCHSQGVVEGNQYVGGLVGNLRAANISNSSAHCNIKSISDDSNAGGLVGLASSLKIDASYSLGSVTGNNIIGGLIGYSHNSSIIQNCYSRASVTGENYVGGFIGNIKGSTISNSYSTGAIGATSDFTGGFIGYAYSSTFEACFWDVTTSTMDNSAGGIGKETAVMHTISPFTSSGWDFKGIGNNGVWNIGNDRNNNYPYLNFQYPNDPDITAEILPTATTQNAENILATEATIYGTITNIGIPVASSFGFCWNRTGEPTTADFLIEHNETPAFGSYSYELTELEPNTTYYIRAFATNDNGTFYGDEITFTTLAIDPTHPNGAGTGADPYQIETLANLLWIYENQISWNKHFIQTESIDASETSIWDDGKGWKPIGSDRSSSFKGVFNGNGKTISNLNINNPDLDYAGLFGFVSRAKLLNITLTEVNIMAKDSTGSLVGYSVLSNITNCHSTGDVEGNQSVGGLAGSLNYSDIRQSSANCNVTSVSDNLSYAGGLIGSGDESKIHTSFSNGTVIGTNYIGGFIGRFASNEPIQNCYSTSEVTGSNYVGGFVGNIDNSNISNCYSTGKIIATGNLTGGFSGNSISSTIEACFWDITTSTKENSAGGTGKETTDMNTILPFVSAGWDFKGIGSNGIWNIGNERNNNYPYLNIQFPNDPDITQEITPTVTTQEVNNTKSTEVIAVGTITNIGIPLANNYGFCWNTTGEPTLTDSYAVHSRTATVGPFAIRLTELEPNTTYYLRAYATNTYGITYGNEISFTTLAIDPIQPIGNGTEGSPYKIATLANLLWIYENRNSWHRFFIQTEDIDASETATWNEGKGWKPIGFKMYNSFSGSYNGNGKTISALNINNPDLENAGLFGYIRYAYLSNITLSDVNIKANDITGSLVGYMYDGTITNCHSDGELEGNQMVGGLAGFIENVTISHCSADCNVKSISDNSSYTGGLIGYASSSKFHTSFSIGSVTGNTCIGGLIGSSQSNSIIQNCYSRANVTGTDEIGGFIGNSDNSTISNSYSTGVVSDTGSSSGGFIGNENNTSIEACFWDATTSTTSNSAGGVGLETDELTDINYLLEAGWQFKTISFNDIWNIGEARNNGYPFLNWQFPDDEHSSSPVKASLLNIQVANIAQNSAIAIGYVVFPGISNATRHGICWSVDDDPTIDDYTTELGEIINSGEFTSELTNLEPGTTYYARAYAINSVGIAYTNTVSFTTLQQNAISICQAVDNCQLLYTTGGDALWFGQAEESFDNVDAAQSGQISGNQRSWIETDVQGFGNLSFKWKISSNTNNNIKFFINNEEIASISGEKDWELQEFYLLQGTHTLRWVYTKNSSYISGSDCAWLDMVVFETITCPVVENLTATNITEQSAVIGWDDYGLSKSWNIEIGAAGFTLGEGNMVSDIIINEYAVTNLDPGTIYEFYVQSHCDDDDESSWSGPYQFETLACNPAFQCAFEFILTDSYGDGWNNNTMNIIQNDVIVATIGSNFTSGRTYTLQVPLCQGSYFELFWNNQGSFSYEVGIQIKDSFGELIYTLEPRNSSLRGTTLFEGYVNCETTCPEPQNLSVLDISTNSATIGWDASIQSSETNVEWGLSGFTLGQGTFESNIPDNNFILNDLLNNTGYEFYVRFVCLNSEIGNWVGPLEFVTSSAVSLYEQEINAVNIDVYPNPSTGVFNVNMQLPTQSSIEISLFDVTGRKVMHVPAVKYSSGMHNLTINQENLSSGYYLLKVNSVEETTNRYLFMQEFKLIIR